LLDPAPSSPSVRRTKLARLWTIVQRRALPSSTVGTAPFILPKLPALVATTREAILMKFQVVAVSLALEENRLELNLLNSARRDLEAAWR
jgi:hypothetical protein